MAPVSKLGADGATGKTESILRLDIVGAAGKTNDTFVYVGAEELTLMAPASKEGDVGVMGIDGNEISAGRLPVLFPIAFCSVFIDAYRATRYSASSGNTAIAESP